MAGHRFEIGECVAYPEKRFPNGVRRTELVAVERLAGTGEPQYRLRPADGVALCVLAESKLGPTASAEEAGRRLDASLEALKGNAMALSEKSQGVVESQLDRIEQRIYDSRISVDAANTRVKTWHDGKKAGFDASRESWKKERRFHQLNSRADDTEAYAIAVFELAAAAADEAAHAALQALLARNDANLAALPPGWADEELAVPA